jgi:GNAT superfamily N-acetyltransferase
VAFPERYGDDPDPYTAAAPVSSDRPPAPHRDRPALAGSTVRYLDTAALDRECPCGWEYDSVRHDQQHVHWSVGIPIPSRLTFRRPVAVVDTMAPKAWRSLAYKCARLAQRDGHYDFASFTHPSEDPEPHEEDLRAYLLATPTRVVGYLSVTDTTRNAIWNFEPKAPLAFTDTVSRPQVGLIFVAREWRRSGVAAALVHAMAADAGMTVCDIAWDPPFTTAGKALARSLSPERIWIGA